MGILKWEVGPVVVTEGRDYAAAGMGNVEGGKGKAEGIGHGAEG